METGTMHVVVWDPSGEYWEGGLVSEAEGRVLRARRVVTLPIEARLVRRGAVGGYFKRGWGAGWPIGSAVPKMACPMMLHVMAGDMLRKLHWAARLVPESDEAMEAILARVEAGEHLVGALRLCPDSGQPGAFSGGFGSAADTSIDVQKLGKPDEEGGWTVGGTATLQVGVDGFFGCCLFGMMPGISVAWAAVSQSR